MATAKKFTAHVRIARSRFETYRLELMHLEDGCIYTKGGLTWEEARCDLLTLGILREVIEAANRKFLAGYIATSLGEPRIEFSRFQAVGMSKSTNGLDDLFDLIHFKRLDL